MSGTFSMQYLFPSSPTRYKLRKAHDISLIQFGLYSLLQGKHFFPNLEAREYLRKESNLIYILVCVPCLKTAVHLHSALEDYLLKLNESGNAPNTFQVGCTGEEPIPGSFK